MKKEILFIGLGNMGLPMSLHLIKKFQSIQGFDLSSKNKKKFESSGGLWLEDLSDLSSVQFVFSMLPGGKQVRELYLDSLLLKLQPGTFIIDCSTSDPQSVIEVQKSAKKRDLKFLSAPVSGGTKGAKEGSLTFMVGGEKEDFQQAQTYLKIMGKNIFHAGEEAGAGQSVKICNNMLLAINMIGTCEAFALAQALGVKAEVLNQIMQASSGNNWSLEKYNPCPGLMDSVPSSNNYKAGFSVSLMLKDLGLAKSCMEQTGKQTELGRKAFEIYKKHLEEGFADKDFSHVFKAINS